MEELKGQFNFRLDEDMRKILNEYEPGSRSKFIKKAIKEKYERDQGIGRFDDAIRYHKQKIKENEILKQTYIQKEESPDNLQKIYNEYIEDEKNLTPWYSREKKFIFNWIRDDHYFNIKNHPFLKSKSKPDGINELIRIFNINHQNKNKKLDLDV